MYQNHLNSNPGPSFCLSFCCIFSAAFGGRPLFCLSLCCTFFGRLRRPSIILPSIILVCDHFSVKNFRPPAAAVHHFGVCIGLKYRRFPASRLKYQDFRSTPHPGGDPLFSHFLFIYLVPPPLFIFFIKQIFGTGLTEYVFIRPLESDLNLILFVPIHFHRLAFHIDDEICEPTTVIRARLVELMHVPI